MTAAGFDTEWSLKTLTAAGMPEAEALAVTALLRHSRDMELGALATKPDIAETRADLLRDIVEFRAELAQSRADLLQSLVETKANILKWMIGMIGVAVAINSATAIGTMLALVRILGR